MWFFLSRSGLNSRTLVIVLISGGASALLAAPAAGTALLCFRLYLSICMVKRPRDDVEHLVGLEQGQPLTVQILVAEHVVMMILSLVRTYIPSYQCVVRGGWNIAQRTARVIPIWRRQACWRREWTVSGAG